jgi:hypothetical protein
MAFNISGLQRVGGSVKGQTGFGAPSLWTYRTADVRADVDTAGYFDNGATTNTGVRNLMAVGDVIFVHANTGGTLQFGILVVNSNSSGIIDTSDATLLGAADSD